MFCHFNICHNRINHFWYITLPLGHQHYWKIQIVYLALVLRKFCRNSVSTMPNHSLRWVNYRVPRSWGDHYTQLLAFEKSCPVTIFEYCFKWRIFWIPSDFIIQLPQLQCSVRRERFLFPTGHMQSLYLPDDYVKMGLGVLPRHGSNKVLGEV